MTNERFVSVVIPVYNDVDRLRLCLEALEGQTYPDGLYEVIVVDNGSRPPIAPSVARFPHVMCVCETRPGSYAARNRGISVARGEVFAFTDADCTPDPTWLEEGVAALEAHPTCGLVAGEVKVLAQEPHAPTTVEIYELAYGFRQAFYVSEGFGATANLFTRRDVIEDVGPFCADLKSCGDREWGMRVRDAGYELVYAGSARVHHPARRSWGDLIKKTTRVSGGMFQLARMAGKGRKESLRVVLSELRPPFRQSLRILQGDGPAGRRDQVAVIATLTFRRWVTALTWLRLEAGSSPRR